MKNYFLIHDPPANIMVMGLDSGQEVLGSNLNSSMDVYTGLDSNLNRGPGLFSSHMQKMTVVSVIYQFTNPHSCYDIF